MLASFDLKIMTEGDFVGCYKKKIGKKSSQTDDFVITSSEALPLSYRKASLGSEFRLHEKVSFFFRCACSASAGR